MIIGAIGMDIIDHGEKIVPVINANLGITAKIATTTPKRK